MPIEKLLVNDKWHRSMFGQFNRLVNVKWATWFGKKDDTPVMATRCTPLLPLPRAAQDDFAAWIDTCVDTQFKPITMAIQQQQCRPNVQHLVHKYGMSRTIARAYLAALTDRGLLIRDIHNGRYHLNTIEKTSVQAGFNQFASRYAQRQRLN